MPYASELNKSDKKPTEKENFVTSTESEKKLPAGAPSSLFTESLDEEIEADLDEMRAHLQAIISNALPGFYEFQQAGYNLLHPKMVDIEALQTRVNTMQIPILIQPQHKLLEQVANAFLDRFRLLKKENEWHSNTLEFIKFRTEVKKAGWEEPQQRDYYQAIKHANRLSGYLSGTLDLVSLLSGKAEQQTSPDTFRQANYDVLLNELLPVNSDAHNNQYAATTRGNLTGNRPDNIKFNAIVDSVTLDERIARERLSAGIEGLAARLLRGITLTSNYAKKTHETDITREIKREIAFLCQALQSVIHVVQYAGQQVQPEAPRLLQQKGARTKTEIAKQELGKTWSTVGQKVQGAIASGRTLSDKFNKNKHRIVHAFPGSAPSDKNGDSHNINKAVFQVGIRLLDIIQQATSDMHKALQASRPLQQAVTHYSGLDEMLSAMPHNSILDAKLRAESGRWQKKAEESKEQLQQLLGTITTLSDERMKQSYLSALRDELKAATNPLVSNNIIRDFDTQVKATVEGLSGIQKALGQTLLRLSWHGKAGGKELDKLTVSWLLQLKDIKDKLKTGIMQATGQSINNFSRQGMLARWMAEWSEADKQRYLGTLSAESRVVTEKHYDTVFFELIQHYLPLLSKESDPQGERLLERLRLEMGNAAEGNTLYPATMADILAGMKSGEQAIRDWSEKKLIRGAFLAVCLDAVTLLPNLAALPLRLPIKFAVTGAKVAWGAHKGRQGIRGGEGDVTDEIAEFAKQSYKTATIKIVLSLPPGLATSLGVASIAWSVYEGGLEGAGKKIAKHIIGEAPWRALDAGSKEVAESYVTTLIDAATTEEQITSVSHSSPLLPQTDVKSFSDEHDSDSERPRVRRRRAVTNAALFDSRSPEGGHNIPSDAKLQSEHFDFDQGIRYENLSDEMKKQAYLNAIKFVLLQIQNDTSLPDGIRNRASLARIGASCLVRVDIAGFLLNNTIFLPDKPGAKSGVLIRLDSEVSYYSVNKGTDLLADVRWALPHNGDRRTTRRYKVRGEKRYRTLITPSGVEALDMMRREDGEDNFELRFNSNNPRPMNIVSLSATLADTIKADYSRRKLTITNKSLIARAIAGAHIPDSEVTATLNLQPRHVGQEIIYKNLPDEKKKQTYLNAIKFLLLQIQNDESLTLGVRNKARLARIGTKLLVPVDIGGLNLNNTIFLPDDSGDKSGVLIRLNSEVPYYSVNKGTDLLADVRWDLPYNGDEQTTSVISFGGQAADRMETNPSGVEILNSMRSIGHEDIFKRKFNYNNPGAMDIVSLSETLADTIEADYSRKKETITNTILISRAIDGAHLPDPEVTATEVREQPDSSLGELSPTGFLRSFSRPFAALAKDMQLVVSFIKGETPQETEQHVHRAVYIGNWFDATAATFNSFTPEGWMINSAQSAAGIVADISERREIDPKSVAGLVIGSIPGDKVAAKVGKFTRIGGNVVKYGLLLGNKVVDLAIVGNSIKTAAQTGDPLDIYRACLASGMSAAHSYKLTKNMSSELKIRIKMDGSAKLNTTQSDVVNSPEAPENGESKSQRRSPQDEGAENFQEVAVYAGPSGRRQGDFGRPTEHRIRLNKFTRPVLGNKITGVKIQSFNPRTLRFKGDDNFALAHVDNNFKEFDKIIPAETQAASINDMEIKTDELLNYLNDFKGGDKDDITNNLRIIKSAFEDIKRSKEHVDTNVESSIYMLVKENSNHEDIKNHYALADMRYLFDKRDVSINYLVAHPYVVINKYPAFRDYLIDNNHIPASDFERYNIKNVARYLGLNALRIETKYYDSFPGNKVKSFSFNGANPITQRLGSQIESVANLLSFKPKTNNQDPDDGMDALLTRRSVIDPIQEKIQHLKGNVRREFAPVKQIEEINDSHADVTLQLLLESQDAAIVSDNINRSKNSEDIDIRDFSHEVITAVDRSFEKVSSVKSLFEHAESQTSIKSELKSLLNEATGLNDEVVVDIDDVQVSDISDMVYNRFKDNINALDGFLSRQKSDGYKSFVLFKYNNFDPSKPDAYALPHDSKKRILLAVLPESQRHGRLVDTVTHEASHNAFYALDHTYIGNVRSETVSFPSSFDLSYRDPNHFYENDRVSKLSTKYALGLPDSAEPTQEQQTLAKVILQNSRLVKSDTLLNAAEYNAFMIDVLSQARIQDSHIKIEKAPSRNRRSASGSSYERDNIIMLALLKVALPIVNKVVTPSENEQERALPEKQSGRGDINGQPEVQMVREDNNAQPVIQSGTGDNNGQPVIADMSLPVSKAAPDLIRFVEEAKSHPSHQYEGPYRPSAGEFIRTAGESIYVKRNGNKYIYINNEYFPFTHGSGNYSLDTNPDYRGRLGIITIGNRRFKIYREKWWWSTKSFLND